MIVRGPRPTSHYTVLPNAVLDDRRLTFKARGLLAYLLSKPDHWRTSSSRLAQAGPDGREAVRTALAELERAGYLRRIRKQDAVTGYWSTVTMVFDAPHNPGDDDASCPQPASDYPASGNRTPQQHLTSNDLVSKSLRVTQVAGPALCTSCNGSGLTVQNLTIVPCAPCKGGGIR